MKEVEAGLEAGGSGGGAPSIGATREHALFCFDVLSAKLKGKEIPAARFDDRGSEFPLFVTWNIESSRGGYRLRGCIGNFDAQGLTEGLSDYALIAALRDHRFSPIALKELPLLQCGVSLLTSFEECQDPYDWTLGLHGVYVHVYETESTSHSPFKRRRSSSTSKSGKSLIHRGPGILTATFLPDVAPAQGWDQTETLNAAIRKAGYSGRIDETLRASLRVVRYQASKATAKYDEWRQERSN